MSGLLPHAVQLCNILRLQRIEIGGCFDQPALYELVQHSRAETVDIHGAAGGEVGQIPQPLGGTLCAGTANGSAIRVPGHGSTAHGTAVRQMIRYGIRRTLVRYHRNDFGDDLPGLLHDDGVADADILLGDEILVVERSVGDGGARQTHRFQHRFGSEDAGAAHLDHDILQHGGFLFRRIFVRNGPLGTLGSAAQHRAVMEIVDLDDRTVDVIGERHPLVAQPADLPQDLLRT